MTYTSLPPSSTYSKRNPVNRAARAIHLYAKAREVTESLAHRHVDLACDGQGDTEQYRRLRQRTRRQMDRTHGLLLDVARLTGIPSGRVQSLLNTLPRHRALDSLMEAALERQEAVDAR